jgi:hypothetical protein
MNKFKIFFSVLSILILFNLSCSNDSQSLLPSVVGTPGEIAVVIHKGKWESEVGEEIRRIFTIPQMGLPQDEPMFDLLQTSYDNYLKLFYKYRNILIIKISDEYAAPKIIVQHNISAKPQIVISVVGKDNQAILDELKKNEEKLRHYVLNAERKRLMELYQKLNKREITDILHNKHKLNMAVPKGYSLDVDSSNFVWIAQEQNKISKNILVYYYPYTDSNAFTPENLIQKRNHFAKKYIPGSVPGSYMVTEEEFPTLFSEYKLKNTFYVAELRGLWRMENGIAMGGPFISVSTLDPNTNRILTLEGFIFAPGENKRNPIRELEAIIYSLDFDNIQ